MLEPEDTPAFLSAEMQKLSFYTAMKLRSAELTIRWAVGVKLVPFPLSPWPLHAGSGTASFSLGQNLAGFSVC